jgi:hypothetical protein
MKKNLFLSLGAITIVSLFMGSCRKGVPEFDCSPNDLVASVSVYASGLNNPRGLKFGPDGNLYVAEGGVGGTNSSTGCEQVVAPVGPYTASNDGARIVKISHSGEVTSVADNIPSSQTAPTQGNLVSGVGDIAFIGKTLYGVLGGAGCSHGVPNVPNGIIKVHADKTWEVVANLSAWQMSHPVAVIEEDDFEPDGTWYSMISSGRNLFALEPNHGELVQITPDGAINRVIDISASQGHIVPTAMVFHNGNFYVGNLNPFPITGNSSVYRITPSGNISIVATGFNAVLGIAFDKAGGMYVLENTTGNPFPTPGTGEVIRVDPSGSRLAIVTGLNLPTAMTFGPDEKLYISNWGFGPPAIGGGEILKVSISCSKDRSAKEN